MSLLAPLGHVFGAVARQRVALYRRGVLRRERLASPVISVGNLSVGGSGKTPVVEHLARLLQAAGLPPAILSRGYRGTYTERARLVSDGSGPQASVEEAGDEPVMLARALPGVVVAVGRRRVDAGRLVEERFGRRVMLLDDGFQHLALERQLDIVCVRGEDLVDRPLPAGRLRETPEALDRADAMLVMDDPAAADTLRARLGAARVFLVRRQVGGVVDTAGAPQPVPRRPFLLSAIARPDLFEQDARALCGTIAGAHSDRDHHRWSNGELLSIWLTEVRGIGADAVLTTAKDAVRLPHAFGELPVRVLAQRLVVDDEPRLLERVLAVGRA